MENESIRMGAAYIRVSTNDQLEFSPESQLDEIKAYAQRNNILLSEEYIFIEEEGISGRKAKKRVQFQEMISTAKQNPKPFDVILLWKFSRFARNQDESTFYKGMLRKKLGIDVVSVSEPIMEGMYGRLIETIIEWNDEFYSYNLSGEVKRGMKKRAERGLYNGKMPLGYAKKPNENPVIVEKEALIVKKIFELFVTGYDKNYIVRYLNEIGTTTKNNSKFTNESVGYILANPFYIGKIRWNMRESSTTSKYKSSDEWVVVDSRHDPIIDNDVWNKAQAKTKNLLLSREKYSHPVSHQKHWLSGMVKCSVCGKSLGWKSGYNGGTNSFQCLGYRMGIHSESQSISERKLVTAVMKSLKMAYMNQNEHYEVINASAGTDHTQLEYLKRELATMQSKEERIKQAYINGIDSVEEYKANKEMLLSRKEEIINKISKLESVDVAPKEVKEKFYNNIQNVMLALDSDIDYELKAEAIRSVIKKIVFKKSENKLEFHYYISV